MTPGVGLYRNMTPGPCTRRKMTFEPPVGCCILGSGVARCTQCEQDGCRNAICSEGLGPFDAETNACDGTCLDVAVDIPFGPSVVTGSCVACQTGTNICVRAVCSPGYVQGSFHSDSQSCTCIEDRPTANCTSCEPGTDRCIDATCKSGYVQGSFHSDSQSCTCIEDRPTATCSSCEPGTNRCIDATCKSGYKYIPDSFDSDSQQCASCAAGIDFSAVPSVATCTNCTGGSIAECTGAQCAPGWHTYDTDSRTCTGRCSDISFAEEPSVEGSCNECTGPRKSQCTAATCAAGYSVGSFGNGTCCRAIVEERTADGCSCVAGHYRDIELTMQCQPCPEGTMVRDDGLGCGCAPGWYDFSPREGNETTSFNKPIAC
eukprot:COSAG02_NODE_7191_length_3127_cov_15.225892_1_plen_373_part_10